MKILLRVFRAIALLITLVGAGIVVAAAYVVIRDRWGTREWHPAKPPVAYGADGQGVVAGGTSIPSPDGDLDWSPDEIRTLKETVGNDTIAVLLEMLRERDGAPVNYRELMERTGRTMPQVRADLAKLSRISRGINSHKSWPIESVDPTDSESRTAYTAPKTYIDWWFEE